MNTKIKGVWTWRGWSSFVPFHQLLWNENLKALALMPRATICGCPRGEDICLFCSLAESDDYARKCEHPRSQSFLTSRSWKTQRTDILSKMLQNRNQNILYSYAMYSCIEAVLPPYFQRLQNLFSRPVQSCHLGSASGTFRERSIGLFYRKASKIVHLSISEAPNWGCWGDLLLPWSVSRACLSHVCNISRGAVRHVPQTQLDQNQLPQNRHDPVHDI